MTRRLKKICKSPMCNALTTNQSGYCDKHNRKVRKPQDTDWFYRTKEWADVSKQYRRVHPTCEICKEQAARLVHHNPPLRYLLAHGLDAYDWDYLQSLCATCHEKEHDRAGNRKG